MKYFIRLLFALCLFYLSEGKSQDVSINILNQPPSVLQGSTIGRITVDICNNDGGTTNVPLNKLRPLISLPSQLVGTSLISISNSGWTILSNDGSNIRFENTSTIAPDGCSQIILGYTGVNVGGPLTVVGTIGFNGPQTVGNIPGNDNSTTSITVANSTDTDGDGITDATDLDDDNDGILDTVENASACGTTVVATGTNADCDGDGIPNSLDLDSDGDGIKDVIEAGGTDPDNDGKVGTGNPAVNAQGIPTAANGGAGLTPPNTDGTDGANPYDADADGDGVNDGTDLCRLSVGTAPTGCPCSANAGTLTATATNICPKVGGTTISATPNGNISVPAGYETVYVLTSGAGLVIQQTSSTPTFTVSAAGSYTIHTLVAETSNSADPNFLNLSTIVLGTTTGSQVNSLLQQGGGSICGSLDVTGAPITVLAANAATCLDTDGDGVADATDVDDDNDGILDTVEEGQLSADTDGDGILNRLDLDSDNDGINDVIEAGGTDANKDGIADGTPSATGVPSSAGTGTNPTDTDGDTRPNPYDLDSDNDGINDLVESVNPLLIDADGNGMVDGTDPDGDGILGAADAVSATRGDSIDPLPADTDGDGIPNYKDLDSDGDGISDLKESGIPNPSTLDTNNDGKIDGNDDPDGDGILTPVDGKNTFGDSGNPVLPDTDGDGIPDYIDPTDTDGDGVADATDLDDDNDGILDTVENAACSPSSLSCDTDSDGIINSLDLDSDNDGINDVNEALLTDANGDGIADGVIQQTSGAIANPVGNIATLGDKDSDTKKDPYDALNGTTPDGLTPPAGVPAVPSSLLNPTTGVVICSTNCDPDGDGILTPVDGLPTTRGDALDTDSDGVADATDLDDDNDGILDTIEDGQLSADTDGDGILNRLDLDSDNDGINDVIEAGGTDANKDGIADGTPSATGVPSSAGTGTNPTDTDGDTRPNPYDLDSDNDGINDLVESGNPFLLDADGNGMVDGTDPDSDGILGGADGLPATRGDSIDPLPADTDGDAIPNYKDLDSDGDGISDLKESGIPNPSTLDTNNDGKIDGNDDPDGDGILTPVDGKNTFGDSGNPVLPDTDGDGIPDYIDASPIANADLSNTVVSGSSIDIPVLSNDKNPDGTVASLTKVTTPVVTILPTKGTAIVNPDGSIKYTPTANQTGTDTFVYTICDKTNPSLCDTARVRINIACTKPVLTVQNITCSGTGTGYAVTFSSNATVTTSNGTVSGNTVTISSGNATLTSTSSCGEVTSIIVTAPTCPVPITCTQVPSLSVGNALCTGTGTYSVSFSASNGTVTSSAGTVSGNTVTNIPVGTNAVLTVTPTSTACNGQTITVTSPASCATPSCTDGSLGISYSTSCNNNGTYTINFTTSVSGTTVNSSANSFTNLTGTVTLTVTKLGCTAQTVIVSAPACVACTKPVLTVQNITCSGTGTGYAVTFSSNATVTTSNGTVSGNTVTVSSGNATLTSTSSCGEVTSIIVTAPTCPVPITCTQVPSLSVGNALCTGTGTYSVSFSASNGTVTSSAGTVSGNTVTNIPVGTNAVLTVTPTSTACNGQTITVTSPASCATPSCTDGSLGISYSTSCNNNGTYTINFTTSVSGTTVNSSANSFTNLTGTVTLTVTKLGCTAQTVIVSAPACVACTKPVLTVQNITCSGTGTGYAVTFSSNATVTTSNGTVSGNTVTVSSGNATLTSTSSCGEVTSLAVTAPSCPVPATCTQVPSLSVGSALCTGTGFYTVSFSASNGTVTSSAGTVSGNTVTNIPVGTNAVLTVTPTSTACNGQTITVTSPASCATPSCTDGSLGISYSTSCNNNGTYTINFTTSVSGTTVNSSANSFTNLTGTVTLTVTKLGCTAQTVIVSAPACVACTKPVLTVQNITCSGTGTGYAVTFSSNATVTTSNGTVSGNTVTVSSGNATLTSTSSCGEVTSIIVTAPTCPVPITCTQVPSLSVGSALCTGTGFYTVSFSASNGTVTSSAGTVSGNTVTNIPVGTNAVLTVTPTSTACNGQTITVTSPASCATPSCTDGSLGISYSTSCNNNGTYTINFTTSVSGTTVNSSANSFTNLTGTVTLTVTKLGCTAQTVIVSAPACVSNTDVKLQLKVFLQGAFFSPSGVTDALMRDNLRTLGVIPSTEPYTAMANSRFTKVSDVGGQTIGAGVLTTSDANSIVDWVFVELRDASNPATVLKTRAALVQRDGDVVEASDGTTPVTFTGAVGTSYYVSIKHRNHLGAMTATAITMAATGTIVDFTSMTAAQLWDKGLVLADGSLGSYDGSEQVTLGNGKKGLWAGNARNADNKVKYSGSTPDPATLLSQVITFTSNTGGLYNYDLVTPVYLSGDLNMDGKVKYAGTSTDTAFILFNIINKYPNNIVNKSYNFDFMIEQIP